MRTKRGESEEYSGIEDNQEYINSKNDDLAFLDDIKAGSYPLGFIEELKLEDLEDPEEDMKETSKSSKHKSKPVSSLKRRIF